MNLPELARVVIDNGPYVAGDMSPLDGKLITADQMNEFRHWLIQKVEADE